MEDAVKSPRAYAEIESDDTATISEYDFGDQIASQLPPQLKPQIVTLWVHDEAFSKAEVLIHPGLIRPSLTLDTFIEVTASRIPSDVRDFETSKSDGEPRERQSKGFDNHIESSHDPPEPDPDAVIRFLCVPQIAKAELLAKHPKLQISIAKATAARFELHNRSQVQVKPADVARNSASHVELAFRDAYLSRSDMWRLVTTELANKVIYTGQKILFLGSLRATVKGINIGSRKVSVAVFSGSTIPVFRSEAARYVLFIQMSREMWDFDSDGDGEILFNRVINGFLPELFERWSRLEVKHLVSIVMFGRLVYDNVQSEDVFAESTPWTPGQAQVIYSDSTHQDFYRVVVTDMSSAQWTTILDELKKDFRIFLRDVSLHRAQTMTRLAKTDKMSNRITGWPVTAMRGNILEAINIAASQFASDYIDRDLVRTGISVVVITAGSGVFEVDRDLLNLTSESLTNNGIGIDIVCLSKMPLHSTPVFKYRPLDPSPTENGGAKEILPHSFDDSNHGLAISGEKSTSNRLLSSSVMSTTSQRLSLRTPSVLARRSQSWCYGIPQWIDLSYWVPESDKRLVKRRALSDVDGSRVTSVTKRFEPRVRMYELQMMGLMELGLADIMIPYLLEQIKKAGSGRQTPSISVPSRTTTRPTSIATSPTTRHVDLNLESVPRQERQKTRPQVERLRARMNKRMTDHDQRIFQTPKHDFRAGRKSISQTKITPVNSKLQQKEALPDRNLTVTRKSEILETATADTMGTMFAPSHNNLGTRSKRPRPEAVKSKSSRNISLAFAGFRSVSRAVASTELKTENVQAQPLARSSQTQQAPTSSSASVLSAPRTDATATTDSDSRSSADYDPGAAAHQSSPIAIKTSLKDSSSSSHNPTRRNIRRPDKPGHHRIETAVNKLDDQENDSSTSEDDPLPPPSSLPASVPKNLLPFIRNVNASNPIKNDPNAASLYGRWQHLYPRKPKAATVKWKSLCTPASVPLTTEDFPSLKQLETDFDSVSYKIYQEGSQEVAEHLSGRESILQEMLSIRLSHGYQLVVQSALIDQAEGSVCSSPTFFKPTLLSSDSDTIYLAMGNTVQKLSYSSDSTITVTKYHRKSNSRTRCPTSIGYLPFIRTILSQRYLERPMEFSGFSEEYPWELADQYLAGMQTHLPDAVEKLRFWRARFVLIPVDPPASAYKIVPSMHDEDEEEIHLRGITALAQLWQRNRYIAPGDRKFKPSVGRKRDPNPLEIKFETLNPSEVVTTEFDKFQMTDDPADFQYTQLLPESELLERETSNLSKVAQTMQSDAGIEIKNRRWHFRLHYNCFRGEDFINWILTKFKDIESRFEAVDFGNELMEHGLFHHVNGKHAFKDGHFFYSLDPKYHSSKTDTSKSSMSGSRRSERSVPPTSAADTVHVDSPLSMRSQSGSHVSPEQSQKSATNVKRSSADRKRVSISLSKMIQLDVDSRKRSNRREVINLHYDRLHNPENCYHLELSWLNVTSKLVEDAIVSWASQSERYGLKLVEVPIAEASDISSYEPFRAPYRVPLAVKPPQQPVVSNGVLTAESFGPQTLANNSQSRHFYQKALLRRFNFVLDLEAASEFPEDVEILYSWGKLEYKHTQFVHRSGVILAQITDEGDLLLLANRLYNTRYAAAKDTTGKYDSKTKEQNRISLHAPTPMQRPQRPEQQVPPASGILAPDAHYYHQHAHRQTTSPASPAIAPTPLLRAVADNFSSPTPAPRPTTSASEMPPLRPPTSAQAISAQHNPHFVTPEQIKDELEAFCLDPAQLEPFYAEIQAQAAAAAPSSSSATATPTLRPSSAAPPPHPNKLPSAPASSSTALRPLGLRHSGGTPRQRSITPSSAVPDLALTDANIPDIQLPPPVDHHHHHHQQQDGPHSGYRHGHGHGHGKD